jgi:hypothetical protein
MAFFPMAASGRTDNSTVKQHAETPLVSLGFAPSSDDPQDTGVIDASSLKVGEPSFHESDIKLNLRGFTTHNDGGGAAELHRLMVDISFAPFHDTLFHAWSFQNDATTLCSCPSAMTVPIDGNHGLNMLLSAQQHSDSALREIPIQLAIERADDVPKLLKGHYFVGLPGRDGALPRWNEYVVRNDPGIPAVERLTRSASRAGSADSPMGPIFMFSVSTPG